MIPGRSQSAVSGGAPSGSGGNAFRGGVRALLVAAILALPLGLVHLRAQTPPRPTLEGRVLRAGQPLSGETVTLHRVAPDSSGAVDRTRAGSDGDFRFVLPSEPGSVDGGPVYFASVRYRGVLYFGSAVNQAAQLDSLYRIEVYDTTTAPPGGASFPVAARNLLLEEAEEGWSVIDLFQIRNDGDRTVVAAEGGIVWSYPLPPEGRGFEVGESDLAPDAVSFAGDSLRVSAPVPPGERTYLIRYDLPELSFTVPLPGSTEHFELLMREPAPEVSVSGAARARPVEIEPGSNYRRFSAADVGDRTVELTAGGGGESVPVAWIAVVLGLVLSGAAIVAVRREPEAVRSAARTPTRREILLRIAELDDEYERREQPSESDRERYRAERERLKSRLRELE